MKKYLAALALAFSLMMATSAMAATDPDNILYIDTKDGRITIEMRPDLAPRHVARVKELVRQHFYDGLTFHRVIPGFMAQGGDPNGNGTGGSGVKLKAEFSSEPFLRGVVGAARAGYSNDTADSQFFIMYALQPSLDGQYTVWGKVIAGMDVVDQITPGEPPLVADKIVKMSIASDTK